MSGSAAAPVARDGKAATPGYRNLLISLAASGLVLAFLYRRIDVRLVGDALLSADPLWLVVAITGILPITWLRAARFYWAAPAGALSGLLEALRVTLVASALNLVAPAKAGDVVKGYVVARHSHTSAGVALALVIYERLCDLFGLIFWCVLGWIISRPHVAVLAAPFWVLLGVCGAGCVLLVSSDRVASLVPALVTRVPATGRLRTVLALADAWPALLLLLGGRRRWIVLISVGLWLAHLVQIWMFTAALQVPIPFFACVSLSAVALMAGQVPFTLAGIGPRDVALVVLMSGHMPPAAAAAIGILIGTRGLVPALIGLPFTWPYVSSMLGDARLWLKRPGAPQQ
jgi:uncharacterized membrane protein YbhN (UPF0104 family)